MGTRITAYGIDCGGFRDWLGRPVSDAMFYIARHARGDAPLFAVHDPERRQRYVINDNRDIICMQQDKPYATRQITPGTANEIPIIAQSLGDFLQLQCCYEFNFLFRSMASCPEVRWVGELTDGYRPGWIFNLLLAARDAAFSPLEMEELECLCARVLRGYQYQPPAYQLKAYRMPPAPSELPVVPVEDLDLKMAVLGWADCERWLSLTEKVAVSTAQFKDPVDEMDRWVRKMLEAFGRIRDWSGIDARMVTFIG